MGWQNIRITLIVPLIFLAVIVTVFTRYKKNYESTLDSLILISTPVLCVILVMLSEYLYWTRAGAGYLIGVQGRYFYPVLVLLLLGLKLRDKEFRMSVGQFRDMYYWMVLMNIFTLAIFWLYVLY